jgi:hypothetical protein
MSVHPLEERRKVLASLLVCCAAAGWTLPASGAGGSAAAGLVLSPAGQPITLPGAGTVVAAAAAPDGALEAVALEYVTGPSFPSFPIPEISLHHFAPDGAADTPQRPQPQASQSNPAIAALYPEGFVAAWSNLSHLPPISSFRSHAIGEPARTPHTPPAAWPAASTDPGSLTAFVLDAAGHPRPGEIHLSPGSFADDVRLAGLVQGGFVASWVRLSGAVALRRFDGQGRPASSEIVLAFGPYLQNVGLAGLADGGFVAAWRELGTGVFLQRFAIDFTTVGAPVQVTSGGDPGPALMASNAAGHLAVAWTDTFNPSQPMSVLRAQVFDADGNSLSPLIEMSGAPRYSRTVAAGIAMDPGGRFVVAWTAVYMPGLSDAFAQLFDAAGAPLGGPVKLNDTADGLHTPHGVFASGDGGWAIPWAWNTGVPIEYLQRFRTQTCSPDPASLCLEANRFRLDVSFRDPRSGSAAAGHPVPLTANTGGLWFFNSAVPELVVKMIDGTALNGHHWLFYASLSDVEFDLTVTDTATGEKRVYHNPGGTLASRADTEAFPLTRAARAGSDAPTPSASASTAGLPSTRLAAEPSPFYCHGLATSLCLGPGRFSVTVSWREPRSGQSGSGQAAQLSPDGGYFWFFAPDGVELAVKVLDGTAVNGHFWVFYASLTDVEFDLTVTDDLSPTQTSRTYHNPAYHLASAADVTAF